MMVIWVLQLVLLWLRLLVLFSYHRGNQIKKEKIQPIPVETFQKLIFAGHATPTHLLHTFELLKSTFNIKKLHP
jgi:hypothetical protein